MADCAAIVAEGARAAGATELKWRGRSADPSATPERLTVAEAFAAYAGVDIMRAIGDRNAFAECAAAAGVRTAADVLYEYPIAEAALARAKPGDPRIAERFEVYACGVELANGFSELTDADEQRRRFDWAMAEKQRIYGERYPIDEDFLAAVAVMPPASGVALGFDRLAMLATGATHIDDVQWTPFEDGREQRR
jgi:lysyl-tRNA synthetase class 2